MKETLVLFRELIENIPVGIGVANTEGKLLAFNEAMLQPGGYTRQDIEALDNITRLYANPQDRERLLALLQKQGYVRQEVVEFRRKDGGRYTSELSLAKMQIGEETYTVAVVQDITARVQDEAFLRQTYELLETVFNSTHVMLAYLDHEFNIIRVNRAYAQANERSPVFFAGKNYFDLYPNDENQAIFQDVIESGEPYFAYARPFEHPNHPEGSIAYLDWSLTPIKDNQGRVTHLILGLVVVTPRQVAVNRLKERERFISLLNKITRAASHALEMQTMLQTLADHLGELFDADGCFITLWDEIRQSVLPGAAYGPLRDKYRHITVEPGEPTVTAAVLESGHPLVIEDTANSPYVSRRIASTFPPHTLLGLPMIIAGEKLGAVLITWDDPHDVTPEEIARGKQAASQVALGIIRARTLEETRTRAALMEKLSIAVGRLNHSLAETEIITETGKAALQLSQADRAAIYLTNSEVRCAWSQGLSAAYLETVIQRIDEMPGGQLRFLTQPILIPNVDELPDEAIIRQLAAEEGYRGVALWPLVFESRTTAAVACYYNQPHHWSATEREVMETLTRQAAAALQNARLYEETTRQAAEFAALLDLTQAMNSEQDTSALLERIVASAKSLLSASAGGMYQYDKEQRELEVVVATDESIPLGLRLKLGEGLAGQVALWRKAMRINDYTTWSGRAASFEGLNVRAVVEAPMLFGGELLGVLVVHETGDIQRTFTEKDARLLSLLASQAAAVLYNARLLDQLRNRYAESEALRRAAAAVTSTLNLKVAIEQILEQLQHVVPYDSAAVMLLHHKNENESYLEIAGGRGWEDPSTVLGLRFPVPGNNPNSIVVQERRAVILEDAPGAYPAFLESPHSHIRSWLGVPMIVNQKVIGMLAVDSSQPGYFTAEHARLVDAYSDHVAIAVQNARLFQETARRAEELQLISDTASALRTAANVAEMTPILVRYAAQIVNGDYGTITLEEEPASEAASTAPRATISQGWLSAANDWEAPLGNTALRFPPGKGITGHVLTTGEVYITHDVLNDPFLYIHPAEEDVLRQMRTLISLPLRTPERVVGVLHVGLSRPHTFSEQEVRLLQAIANMAGNALHRASLHEQLEENYLETVMALANAMDARDTYTGDHSKRMAQWGAATARELGCNEEEIETIRWAAQLHDIGKIGVPDAILQKPGKLTEAEWEIIKRHPEIGAKIVSPVARLQRVAPLIRAHQEKFDGSGYPDGLKGDAIPLGARILAVVDAYSAITDARPYKKARSHAEAVAELRRCAGSHFDPQVVEAFLKIIGEGETEHL